MSFQTRLRKVEAAACKLRPRHQMVSCEGMECLQIDPNLCQEDWGVGVFARRNQMKFWIGLSVWDSPSTWVAHFHHGLFLGCSGSALPARTK